MTRAPPGRTRGARVRDTLDQRIAYPLVRAGLRALTRDRLSIETHGLEYLPETGPVLLAARHYHHLYDVLALMLATPRRVHCVVAVDWIHGTLLTRLMRGLTGYAHWPTVWRVPSGASLPCHAAAFQRRAVQESARLLQEGRVLLVFPEGYPTVDLRASRKKEAEFLPFQSGFATLALAAQARSRCPVPIVPLGFAYQRTGAHQWRASLRFGTPLTLRERSERDRLVRAVESRVRRLSEATL